jgi:hypothetical protein
MNSHDIHSFCGNAGRSSSSVRLLRTSRGISIGGVGNPPSSTADDTVSFIVTVGAVIGVVGGGVVVVVLVVEVVVVVVRAVILLPPRARTRTRKIGGRDARVASPSCDLGDIDPPSTRLSGSCLAMLVAASGGSAGNGGGAGDDGTSAFTSRGFEFVRRSDNGSGGISDGSVGSGGGIAGRLVGSGGRVAGASITTSLTRSTTSNSAVASTVGSSH